MNYEELNEITGLEDNAKACVADNNFVDALMYYEMAIDLLKLWDGELYPPCPPSLHNM